MTNSTPIAPSPYGLLRATEAVTNWRALAMTGLACLALFLFMALTVWLGRSSLVLGAVFGLVTFVVGLIGYSSVGILLMRQAQEQEVGFMDAILQAIFSVHRLLGVAVLLFLVFLGVAITALLILFVCRIPGLGPFLYSFVLPILTVILGMTIAGMLYVGFPLAAPAIWEGNTVFQTVARLIVIVRRRLLPVITNLVVLSLLVFFLSSVVWVILFSGYSTTLGLSLAAGIHSAGGITSSVMSMVANNGAQGGMDGFGGEMAYAGSFAFATGLIFMIGAIVPFLTFVNGTCLVYLQTVEGLNFGETEEQLRGHVDEAKRRAQEAKERASSKLQEARDSAQRPAPAVAIAPAGRVCKNCKASLAADDIFCGECGTQNPL